MLDLAMQMRHRRDAACERISNKLASISYELCRSSELQLSGARSIEGEPILVREVLPTDLDRSRARVLLIGGIHGDELSSISIVFKWFENSLEPTDFHWRISPVVNPDGMLRRRAQRMNANGVDLNRNFPTPNWEEESREYWIEQTDQNPRRYPGPSPLSEPETQWLAREIDRFKPDVIVSVHAPHHIVDFDGPENPPERLGPLRLQLLGTYPGSLGRFAGVQLQIPVVTIELPRAGTMPSAAEQQAIWHDLVSWLEEHHGDQLDGSATAEMADPDETGPGVGASP